MTPNPLTPVQPALRRRRNERGLALLMTILVLSSLLILGATFSNTRSTPGWVVLSNA